MNNATLETAVQQFVKDNIEYYQQWLFDEPVYLSSAHIVRLQRLQHILLKLIRGFVEQYEAYCHLMPVSTKVRNVLDIFSERPYYPGTYRTDFVYAENQQVKLIEITCRFALNGIFLAAVIRQHTTNFLKRDHPDLKIVDLYQPIFEYLEQLRSGAKTLVVLQGADTRNESKIYQDIYKEMGVSVHLLQYTELKENLNLLEESWVVSELSMDEILSLDKDIIQNLAALNIINDFRTIFLVHDKRFFSVLGDTELQSALLSQEEIDFFKNFYVNTYNANQHPDIVAKARSNKNGWILKHRALGKSQSVYAGIVTDEEVWSTVLNEANLEDYVLQEWIPQRRHQGEIQGEPYQDFLTGTLIFFDDNFFGFGDFRTSSHPVTNVVDHRKASSVIVSEEDIERLSPNIAICS